MSLRKRLLLMVAGVAARWVWQKLKRRVLRR